MSPRPAVSPRPNLENNATPITIETPRQHQENTNSNPRQINTPRVNGNENMPRNSAPAPRTITNSTPRNATPRNATPRITTPNKNATKIEGRH